MTDLVAQDVYAVAASAGMPQGGVQAPRLAPQLHVTQSPDAIRCRPGSSSSSDSRMLSSAAATAAATPPSGMLAASSGHHPHQPPPQHLPALADDWLSLLHADMCAGDSLDDLLMVAGSELCWEV
jgi:hypothetical protein